MHSKSVCISVDKDGKQKYNIIIGVFMHDTEDIYAGSIFKNTPAAGR